MNGIAWLLFGFGIYLIMYGVAVLAGVFNRK